MDKALTQEEREFVVGHLSASRDRMLAAIDSLTQAQWNFKPDADTWSVAECCEHVVLLERMLLQRVQEAPELAELPDVAGKERIILKRVAAVRQKVTAPEFARPQGRWAGGDELKGAFASARQASIEFAAGSRDPLHWKVAPHFALGLLDGYQWLIFMGSHCERHVRQVEAVKALPDFPRT
jgi:hypothetical protein